MSHTLLWKRFLIWSVCLWGILFALPNAFYPTVERHNDAVVILAETGALPGTVETDLEGWPSWLPSSLVALGLDLRGGAHLLAEVHFVDVHAARMEVLWPQVRDALRALRDQVGTIRRLDAPAGELGFILSPRLERNTTITPALGAKPNSPCAMAASPSCPLRKSTGFVAITIRTA